MQCTLLFTLLLARAWGAREDPQCGQPLTCTLELGGELLSCHAVQTDEELSCQLDLFKNYNQLYIRYSSIQSLQFPVSAAPISLDASFNPSLTTVLPNVLTPTIRDMIFRSNQISKFPFDNLNTATSLIYLSLLDNRIPSLPQVLPNAPLLEYLDLSHNLISSLEPAIFQHLPSLKMILLTGNHLKSLRPLTLAFNQKGVRVELGWNSLSRFDLDIFTDQNLPGFLDLRNNKLQSIDEKTFRPIIEYMKTLGKQASLMTSGNPVKCSCDLKWLKQWGESHKVIQKFVHVTCWESGSQTNVWDSETILECIQPTDSSENSTTQDYFYV